MDIELISKELTQTNLIKSRILEWSPLSGGTVSQLYLLRTGENVNYVVKVNSPEVIRSEAHFLSFYKDKELLPTLLFVEPSNKYLVMSYIPGSTGNTEKAKKVILKELVKRFINHYKTTIVDGWGWADNPTDSWQSFLLQEVVDANEFVNEELEKEDFDFVLSLVKDSKRNPTQHFLIHGDCGFHNFIFYEGRLSGIIDPTPIIGNPMYDLIYAFCSSPNDLSMETIEFAASHMSIKLSRNLLYEEVIIGLFIRLGRCIKHHPKDLRKYLEAWEYWKSVLHK